MRPLMKMSDFTFRFIFFLKERERKKKKYIEGANYKVVKWGGELFYATVGQFNQLKFQELDSQEIKTFVNY